MANTSVQLEVEDWVREQWMPANLGHVFSRKRLKLSCGGFFDFDAVCDSGPIAATISTSGARTASGKNAVGKLLKIRSDIYFLLLAPVSRRLVVLTERDMFEQCCQERESGRVPDSIEFVLAEVPECLAAKLVQARAVASREVTPARRAAGDMGVAE
ncbi:MAG: hypothetical protein ACE149_06940 [Armatimonadota bacterium]